MQAAALSPPGLCGRSYRSYLDLKREKNGELFAMFDAIICGVRKTLRPAAAPPLDGRAAPDLP